MIGLTSLEVYNSIFNTTEENNKFELQKLPDEKSGGVSYEKVRDEIERDLHISDITAPDLQDDIKGPIIIKDHRERIKKRKEDGGYMNILASYTSYLFPYFERYLRTEVDLVEDDFRLVLYKIISSFLTYELKPGFYNFRDLSEFVFNILQPKYQASSNVIVNELDDITRKTILVVRNGIIAIRFDEKSFFNTLLGLFYSRLGLLTLY